jgi:hypothetical protein
MTFSANKLFLATAVVFALLWVICSALVAVIPDAMLTMTGYMVHAELETFRWSLTGAGFAGGLLLWALVPGITVWLIAAAYNRLVN